MTRSMYDASLTRRRFLGTTSSTLAGVALGLSARPLQASELTSRQPLSALIPDQRDPEILRQLARTAVGVAVAAGASYADIRVAERRVLSMKDDPEIRCDLGFDYSYGLRVCVDGIWGFGHGVDPTPQSVTATARAVVANLKGLPASLRRARTTLPPVPVATGEWATPVLVDPFAISPDDHVAMMEAHRTAVERVRGGLFWVAFLWHGENRVFASSEGSLITQYLTRAMPSMHGSIMTLNPLAFRDGGFSPWNPEAVVGEASAGFEITQGPALQEKFKEFAEDAVKWSSYPTVFNYPIGRYDTLLDGLATGSLLGGTVVRALSLDRALGLTRSSDSDSFLRPVESTLGAPAFSPLLELTADRSLPNLGAVRWDDEGVEAQSFPLVSKGAVTAYFGTRATLAELSESMQSAHTALPLRGSAIAPLPTRAPIGAASCVRMTPGTAGPTFDAMIRDLGTGIIILGNTEVSMDSTLGNGVAYLRQCFEVKNGKVTRQIMGAGIQFSTKKLWQNIVEVGASQTMQPSVSYNNVGQPSINVPAQLHTPAMHLRGVGLIDLEANSL